MNASHKIHHCRGHSYINWTELYPLLCIYQQPSICTKNSSLISFKSLQTLLHYPPNTQDVPIKLVLSISHELYAERMNYKSNTIKNIRLQLIWFYLCKDCYEDSLTVHKDPLRTNESWMSYVSCSRNEQIELVWG